MEAVYYERHARSPAHIHAGSYANCIYIPSENIILYREQRGTFGKNDYSFTTNEHQLNEAMEIAQGKLPTIEGVSYTNVQKCNYDDSAVLSVIQNAKLKKELDSKVQSGIEGLINCTGHKRDSVDFCTD